jgi:hypothetical protein
MKKNRERGSALFISIMFAFIGLILVAGIYFAYHRSLMVIFPVRTYSNLREGVTGTIHLVARYIDKGNFSDICLNCPPGLTPVSNASAINCCETYIKIKLIGYPGTFPVKTQICCMGSVQTPGNSTKPVVEKDSGEKSIQTLLFAINAEGRGPQGASVFIESLYETISWQ